MAPQERPDANPAITSGEYLLGDVAVRSDILDAESIDLKRTRRVAESMLHQSKPEG